MDTTKLLSSRDGSKKFRRGAEFDYRTGNQDIGKLLSFAPYEKGYCFLTVMETPKIMRTTTNISDGDNEDSYRKLENDNRDRLLWTFVDILELEFMGLSGLEDQTLETNDISNNIQNASIVSKNNRSTYTNISMSFTEKSGTPITKFMERYTNYLYDPYSMAKTYGGRLRTDKAWVDEVNAGRAVSVNKRIDNECFTLLYVVTDSTCLLVEKAFILYRDERKRKRDLENHPLDNSILELLDLNNEEVMTENSNKNAILVSTQRDLIAGEISKHIAKSKMIPKDIVDAHERGIIHIHK